MDSSPYSEIEDNDEHKEEEEKSEDKQDSISEYY